MIAAGVCPSTQLKYLPSTALWYRYRSPGGTSNYWMYLIGLVERDAILILIQFLLWMVETLHLPSGASCHHMTGVRYDFRNHCASLAPFDSDSMRKAKAGLLAQTREQMVQRKVVFEKLPLLVVQLDWLRFHYWMNPTSTIDDRMTYIAIVSGFNVSLRIGEIAYEGPYKKVQKGKTYELSDHRFFLMDIHLEDEEGNGYSHAAYMSLPMPRPRIVFMCWEAPSSKSSNRRPDGKQYQFGRGCERESQYLDDLLYFFTLRGHTNQDEMIFSRKGSRLKKLTGHMVRDMLRKMAIAHGMNPENYSGKSLRKGGLTSMATSGRSALEVLANSGHAHLETSAIYVNTGCATGNALRNEEVVTVQGLKRSLPINNKGTAPVTQILSIK